MTKDMTTGSPAKLILSFSIPLLIGNIFQQFYSMADTIIVGRFVGLSALGAVGSTGAISFLILGFAMGLTGGFTVVTAQRFGAEDEDGMRHSVATSIYLCVGCTVVLTAVSMLGTKPLLRLMDTPADLFDDAYAYIIIIFAGIVSSIFYNMISGVLRALGDSKTPLYFLIVASALNVVLDLVFIINFHMGVAGAAVATVIAQLASGFLCLIYTAKKFPQLHLRKEDWRWDPQFAWQHLRIGLPMAFQFSITAIGAVALQGAINSFGSLTVSAYTAASKVDQLATQPLATFGVTMATYAGQNLGAGRIDRIRKGVRECCKISFLFSVGGGLVIVFFGKLLMRMFITGDQPEVLQIGQYYLNLIAGFYFVLGLLFIYRNALQGMGDAFVPMMAGVCELVMRCVVAFFLAAPFGYAAVCLAGPIAWIAAAALLLVRYYVAMKKMDRFPPASLKPAGNEAGGA